MSQERTIASIIKPYSFTTHYLDINDSTTIAYVDEGRGDKTLIFVHGLATYLPSWQKNIPELKKHYRCIAIDLPGYGRSSKSLSHATMSYYAQSINQLIEKLKLEKVTMVGHSMGAQVSMTVALQYPEKVESLILAAPAGFETFNEKEAIWLRSIFKPEAVAAASPEQIRFNYGLNFYKMTADVEFMIQDRIKMTAAKDFMLYCKTISKGVSGMLDEPVFQQLKDLQQPVMVVYGENDALIPNPILHKAVTTADIAKKGHEQLPNSQLKMIRECGHFVPFEKPDIFNRIIVDFLGGR
ncbi:hydrolase, alpha/beta fold family protein [Fulvivirga imtechensis AK7]|uniref:Hydrolase, alpha/beta fold family protein n=2 Tax=Fulvivirga TaxID=396811 RepID=L8JQN3_9BACT|nr:hydrolase, alpha/beta fold family protein [Fulvivirga imtechensis AK7]